MKPIRCMFGKHEKGVEPRENVASVEPPDGADEPIDETVYVLVCARCGEVLE